MGDVRCEGVSCAPIEIESVATDQIETEQIDREEEVEPIVGVQDFCVPLASLGSLSDEPEEPEAGRPTCMGDRLIVFSDDQLIVATKFVTELDSKRVASGLRLAGYSGGELRWESTELQREQDLVSNFFGDAFAIGASSVPGEAVIGTTHETGAPSVYGQTFYAVKADGELQKLFDDKSAGRILEIAAFGDDILVVSEYELRLEVTRYNARGAIVWRQTTLEIGDEWPGGMQTEISAAALRVIDGERILVLVPRRHSFQLHELSADGELVRVWVNGAAGSPANALYFGARLAAGTAGQFVVGYDGYHVDRGSLEDGEPSFERFTKQRLQYFTPEVFGLYVDRAGYIYVSTIEGIRTNPFGLIERVSPDLKRRESFVIDNGNIASEGLGVFIGGELYVTDDQRTLYFAAGGTLGSLELPPIED